MYSLNFPFTFSTKRIGYPTSEDNSLICPFLSFISRQSYRTSRSLFESKQIRLNISYSPSLSRISQSYSLYYSKAQLSISSLKTSQQSLNSSNNTLGTISISFFFIYTIITQSPYRYSMSSSQSRSCYSNILSLQLIIGLYSSSYSSPKIISLTSGIILKTTIITLLQTITSKGTVSRVTFRFFFQLSIVIILQGSSFSKC